MEGLADLLHASTELQHAQAVWQLDGALGRLYEGWRQQLIEVLAHCEAVIDFAEDEADVAEEQVMRTGPVSLRVVCASCAPLTSPRCFPTAIARCSVTSVSASVFALGVDACAPGGWAPR